MALIATEPVVKAPFVENCMHTRLVVNVMQNDPLASFIENCMHMRLMVSVMQNDPSALFYLLKPLLNAIRAIKFVSRNS